uniref:AIG1-type G domain-containing protein n=1 Tax=Oreochromis aureus TaxID=47969 RepID=A0A668SRB1_OREAU
MCQHNCHEVNQYLSNSLHAAGNTILGKKNIFKSTLSASSVTSNCEKKIAEVYGQILAVVDTPGLFDTILHQDEVKKEIARCISFVAPGPHVFLVVIRAGRFTEEEKETVKILQKMFGEEAAGYTMALFTRGDDLEADETTITNIIKGNAKLSEFISQCGGGYHVFNNRKEDQSQVRELLKKINTMVDKNGGRYYTNEMFEKAEEAIREEMEKLMKENPEMEPEEAREMAEGDNSFIRKIAVVIGTTVAGTAAGLGTAVYRFGQPSCSVDPLREASFQKHWED